MTKRMADSTVPANLPAGFDAYLGYLDGRWPDYRAIADAESVPVYGLSTSGATRGSGVDTEPGNVDPAGAAQCLALDKAAGVDRPIGYCPESWAAALVAEAAKRGLSGSVTRAGRFDWRLLTAHYGHGPHICGPSTCGCPVEADGTQWVDHGPFDESLLDDSFIRAASHPGPAPAVPGEVLEWTGGADMEFVVAGAGGEWLISVGGGRAGKLRLPTPADGSTFYAEARAEERNADTVLPVLSDACLAAIADMAAGTGA